MKSLSIDIPQNSYPIYIEKGLLSNVGNLISDIYFGDRLFVVTDENVNKYYGERLKESFEENNFQVYKVVIEPGENSKSMQSLLYLYDKFLSFGITRDDLIVAFGGGVVGDLTGFVAATLLRGIPYVQIPTSLLAQIDSSIGGKVGIDLPQGKNLAGSFYHPKGVFIDPQLLKTLNNRFLRDGMGEVIKYGCIEDRSLFYNLFEYKNEEELFGNIDDIIYTCCSLKKAVVEKDEKDKGKRMILNFGHTLGHAIEKYFSFNGPTHGEAVAIGMYNITVHSENMGLTKKGTANDIKDILKYFELSYDIEINNWDEIYSTIFLDKKSKGDCLNIVLLNEIGSCFINNISKDEIGKFIGPFNK